MQADTPVCVRPLCCLAAGCYLPAAAVRAWAGQQEGKLLRHRRRWATTACWGGELGCKGQQLQLPAELCEMPLGALCSLVLFHFLYPSFHGPPAVALFCTGKSLQHAFLLCCVPCPSPTAVMSEPGSTATTEPGHGGGEGGTRAPSAPSARYVR